MPRGKKGKNTECSIVDSLEKDKVLKGKDLQAMQKLNGLETTPSRNKKQNIEEIAPIKKKKKDGGPGSDSFSRSK